MLQGCPSWTCTQGIVLAAAGQSHVEKNFAQAPRSTFPHSVASTKDLVHPNEQDDWQKGEETLATSTSRDEEEIDALVTEFKTVSWEECNRACCRRGHSLVCHQEGVEKEHFFKKFGQKFEFPLARVVSSDHGPAAEEYEMLSL